MLDELLSQRGGGAAGGERRCDFENTLHFDHSLRDGGS
jgi:hypothetical protein